MVLVLVFTLFGAIAGKEDSPRENLERLLSGGFNERQQAAFNLVRQVLEYRRDGAQESGVEWEIDESFLPRLRAAREEVGEIDGTPGRADPAGALQPARAAGRPGGRGAARRHDAARGTARPRRRVPHVRRLHPGGPGGRARRAGQERATEALVALLGHEDDGLVLVALAGLQNLPGEASVTALRGMLTARSLQHRGTAALSLSELGDPAGADVLREMLGEEAYGDERGEDPEGRSWPPQRVSESRCKALAALLDLGLPPARRRSSSAWRRTTATRTSGRRRARPSRPAPADPARPGRGRVEEGADRRFGGPEACQSSRGPPSCWARTPTPTRPPGASRTGRRPPSRTRRAPPPARPPASPAGGARCSGAPGSRPRPRSPSEVTRVG